MRIKCPQCHTGYRLDKVDADAILVCHRCNCEFRTSEVATQMTEKMSSEPAPAESHTLHAKAAEAPVSNADVGETHAPPSAAPHPSDEASIPVEGEVPEQHGTGLWPWFLVVLFFITAAGIWINKDAWLSDPWLRSVLINMDIPLQIRDTDWRIIPDSVHSQWVLRDDGKHVLVIEGRVKNLLQTDLPPPHLRLRLFAADGSGQLLGEQILTITQPPLLGAIRKAPYTPPPPDTVPVTARGERGFILVLEDAPESMGDFTLQPVAR